MIDDHQTKVKGVRRNGKGWRAFVRFEKKLYLKSFPLNTAMSVMVAWRERTVSEIKISRQLAAIAAKRVPPSLDGWCYVYFVRSGDVVKIGRAVQPRTRLRELQTAHPEDLVLLATVAAHMALEGAIHKRFEHLRTRATGEWFRLDEDLIAFIHAIKQGANPVELLFEDPRVVLSWHLHPPPAPTDGGAPCPED